MGFEQRAIGSLFSNINVNSKKAFFKKSLKRTVK
jgi:hypothetical protein